MARRLSQAPGAFREVLPRVALALFLPLFAFVYSAGAASETPTASASASSEPRIASCNTPGGAHALKGTVTDPTGAAISSASVVFLCGGEQKSVVTTAGGTFSLNLLPGNYQVRIAAPGFSQLSRDLALTGADPYQPVNFALALGTAQNTVTVSADGGFVGADAATGTKTDTALVEVPQSVSVITLAELQDRNVQTLDQALQYTPGVSPSVYGQDDRFDWITIRGFAAQSYGLFRDGLHWQSSDTTGRAEPFDLDEIDVLKGPAASSTWCPSVRLRRRSTTSNSTPEATIAARDAWTSAALSIPQASCSIALSGWTATATPKSTTFPTIGATLPLAHLGLGRSNGHHLLRRMAVRPH
jgi:hypothetical protein